MPLAFSPYRRARARAGGLRYSPQRGSGITYPLDYGWELGLSEAGEQGTAGEK
jgi:hypothetical protein